MIRTKTTCTICAAVLATAVLTHSMTSDVPAQLVGEFGGNLFGGGTGARSIQSTSLIVVPMVGNAEGSWLAFGTKTGRWTRHSFPPEQTVNPVLGANVAAFAAEGDQITELVAIDQAGHFRTHRLPRPTNSLCSPTVSAQVACYPVDGRVYAFSGVTGTWDSIPSNQNAIVSWNFATIHSDRSVAAFSAETGLWTVASLTDGEQP